MQDNLYGTFINNQTIPDTAAESDPTMQSERKRFKAAGFAIFAMAMGHMLSRVAVHFIFLGFDRAGVSWGVQDVLINVIFTILAQIVFCFAVPFFIYKKTLNLNAREIFLESNFRKTRNANLALSVPIGIAGIFLGLAVGFVWLIVLVLFGYSPPGGSGYPAEFNPALFILSLVLIAVLPALCEEFVMRGIFLNSMRKTFAGATVFIIGALSFGLFHQNIGQLVNTAIWGGIYAYIVIKTGSIWPAIIIHFVNNFLAVVMSYAAVYGWGNGFVERLYEQIAADGFFSIFFTAALALAVIIPSLWLMNKWSKKDKTEEKITRLYRPTLRESAFFIGAIVLTAISTVLTFAFRA